VKLSIVELATIKDGGGATDALHHAVETARYADALGFHRIWFAEHHMAPSQASHHPELLIAAAAALTKGIRLGSGAVLLNHYSPFKVAEMFKQLEAMYPGRIDLGIGRATAGPMIDVALKRDRQSRSVDDYGAQLSEVIAWLHNAFPDGHPFADKPLMPSVESNPEAWLLGSSPGGAQFAAQLGIGYSFAGFINPPAAAMALQSYRRHFTPTQFGAGAPQAMLGVNVSVGETDEEGERLASSVKGYYARLRRIGGGAMVPSIEDAAREMRADERDEPTAIISGRWPRFVAGGPPRVRDTLLQMAEESGADEIIVQNMIADPRDRRRSHELLARAFDLPARDVS
jgi:luciferase family oxidoreductase group 1